MLSKDQRLTTKEVDMAFQARDIKKSSFFLIYLLKSESNSRFSIAIPKKSVKLANKRNLYRRRVYRSLEKLYPQIIPGFSCVLVLQKGVDMENFTEDKISIDLQLVFKKIGLI
jgi:ribonuclease P protein component